jgi:uncharacterized protein (TIGR02231 family)
MSSNDTTPAAAASLVTFHPAVDESRRRLTLPITKVTVLEDRAQIERRGPIDVVEGANRLAVWDVAPVLQDVSLRVEVTQSAAAAGPTVRVEDARVRRATRVGHKEKPEAAAALERRLEELVREHASLLDDAERTGQRAGVVGAMMQKAVEELPTDAAWSLGDPSTWTSTFEALSGKTRQLLSQAQATRRRVEEVVESADFVGNERARLDRPDTRLLAIIEIDARATAAGSVEFVVEYTVPAALWRPTHEATLDDGVLTVASRAAVWQNTGEDWSDVEVAFSTARSSLGHEPPRLSDDVLTTQKKDSRVVVSAREVAVQSAGLGRSAGGGGGAPRPAGVDLPGVDDGGDIQLLKSLQRVSVPSDGRPCFVPVGTAAAPANTTLVIMGELEKSAFVKATAEHRGTRPLLAGPVELVRSSGFVGTTRTMFVAPGERFALGFGRDDDVRVQRTADVKDLIDAVDQWRRRTHTVQLYLSNLGGEEKRVEIVERIPVSETEHVKVTLVADKTSGTPAVDADGLVRWTQTIAPRGRLRLVLVFVVAYAPGVAVQ